MSKLISSSARGSRLAALAVSALTVLSLLVLASPANAADPTSAENFHPDEVEATTGGLGAAPELLSDRPDGSTSSDATAHVTTVTTPDAAVVEWHLCDNFADTGAAGPAANSGEVGDAGVDADPNLDGDCFKVGEDTTGVIPAPGPAGAGEAYELNFDIPAAQEDLVGNEEVVAYVCTSTTTRTDANCDSEVEDDIAIDDSSTPANPPAQSSAGEITFPGHGSSVSNAGVTMTASTSPDVTGVLFCLAEDSSGAGVPTDPADEGQTADGDGDPGQCDNAGADGTPDNPVSQQGTFKTWSTFLTPVANAEYALVLFETEGGAGLCSTSAVDCQLDSHYIVSSLATPTEIKIALDDAGTNCAGTNVVTSDTAIVGFTQNISGCIYDQSGNLITDSLHWAFQATPDADPGATTLAKSGFFPPGEGIPLDRNLNNFFELVNGDPGASGAVADVDFSAEAPGSWTLTFCLDSNNDAEPANPAQSSTPCAGEALTATATKNGIEDIDHVHVKKQSETDALCHTASSSTTAPAGSVITLQGCALGLIQTTGDEVPVGDVHVLWIVNPAANPDDPGQVNSQTNMTDAQGHATAQVSSGPGAGDKTTTIRFCLDQFPATGGALAGNGICDAFEAGRGPNPGLQADYQINWTQPGTGGCPQGFNRIRGDNQNNLLIGTASCDKLRARGGDDTSRGKAGNDVLNGGKGEDKGNGGPGTDKCVKTEKERRCES